MNTEGGAEGFNYGYSTRVEPAMVSFPEYKGHIT